MQRKAPTVKAATLEPGMRNDGTCRNVRSWLIGTTIVGALAIWRPLAANAADELPKVVGDIHAADSKASEATIAVLGFNDRGPSTILAPLRFALVDMLVGELSGRQGLLAVERMHVDKFLSEYNLGQSGLIDDKAVLKAGNVLTATYLLTGDFFAKPGELKVTARLYKTGEDKPMAEWSAARPESQIVELSHSLGEKALSALNLKDAKPRPASKPAPSHTPRVALLAFKNHSLTPRLNPMESGFADILQGSLGMLQYITLIERKELYRVLREQELTVAQLAEPQTAVQVGRLLGAERLVYGSFLEIEKTLHIDVKIVDAETAAIIKTQSISGPVEKFDTLLEDLAMKLADDLIIVLNDDTRKLIQAATPAHHIEAAIHWANAEHGFLQGRYAQSAEDSERVLLLEPNNIHAAKGRTRGWYFQQDYPKVMESANQALGKTFSPEQRLIKIAIYDWLLQTYWTLDQNRLVIAIANKEMAEFPDVAFVRHRRAYLAAAMIKINRSKESAEMLEEALKAPNIKDDSELYVEALERLYHFHRDFYAWSIYNAEIRNKLENDAFRQSFAEETKQHAMRAIEIFAQMQVEGKGHRDLAWNNWAVQNAFEPPDGYYLGSNGVWGNPLVSPEKKIEFLETSLKVFGWKPEGALKGYLALSQLYRQLGHWDEAARAYEYVATHPFHEPRVLYPPEEDCHYMPPITSLEKRIDAAFCVGDIEQRQKGHNDEAIRRYQKLISDYGVSHWRASNAISALHELNADFELPQKAVLVWGGGTDTHKAWQKVLEPMGYAVHAVNQYEVTTALLAQYDLVILARMGMIPFSPNDILALRNYVGSGGSLLCVVTPGWEHATPSLHNPLLNFFGVHADNEMVLTQKTTEIVPHPITAGAVPLNARNFVNLKAPDDTRLVEVGDKTVLVAMPYRFGRVVVTSLGQWYLPDPRYRAKGIFARSDHWIRERRFSAWPIGQDSEVAMPMLKNTLAWLSERDGREAEISKNRQLFRQAMLTALKTQYRVRTADERAKAIEELVGTVGDSPDWKEEALWAAAETSFDGHYEILSMNENEEQDNFRHPRFGWEQGDEIVEPNAKLFQQLVDEFPQSPLREYAVWRKADAERCSALLKVQGASRVGYRDRLNPKIDWSALSKKYEHLDLKTGSIPWQWSQLRMGHLDFHGNDLASALTHYEAVSERAENGAEKTMAQYGCGLCCQALNRLPDAITYFDAVVAAPEISWVDASLTTEWIPPDGLQNSERGLNSHRSAREWLQQLR